MRYDPKWEYRVETIGSTWSSAKDEDLEQMLNEWSEEGWDLIVASPIGDNKVRLIARREILSPAQRKHGWP